MFPGGTDNVGPEGLVGLRLTGDFDCRRYIGRMGLQEHFERRCTQNYVHHMFGAFATDFGTSPENLPKEIRHKVDGIQNVFVGGKRGWNEGPFFRGNGNEFVRVGCHWGVVRPEAQWRHICQMQQGARHSGHVS